MDFPALPDTFTFVAQLEQSSIGTESYTGDIQYERVRSFFRTS